MKRIISLLTVILIILSLCTPVYADDEVLYKDFFKKGEIKNVSTPIITIQDVGSGNAIYLNAIIPPEIVEAISYFGPSFEYIYGTKTNDLSMGFQIDYKIPNGNWHYNESWNTFKYDNMKSNTSIYDTKIPLYEYNNIHNIEIFNSLNTDATGDIASLIISSNDGKVIDYTAIKFRTRIYVKSTLLDNTPNIFFSDWSEEITPQYITIDENYKLATPKIINLTTNPQNNSTAFDFSLQYEDEIYKQLATLQTLYNPQTKLIVQAYIIPINEEGKFNINDAQLLKSTTSSPEPQEELMFLYEQGEIRDLNNWSFVVKLITDDKKFSSDFSPQFQLSVLSENDPNKDEEGVYIEQEPEIIDKCSLCNICSQPLGICIFAYIIFGFALLVLIVVLIFLIKSRRDKY